MYPLAYASNQVGPMKRSQRWSFNYLQFYNTIMNVQPQKEEEAKNIEPILIVGQSPETKDNPKHLSARRRYSQVNTRDDDHDDRLMGFGNLWV